MKKQTLPKAGQSGFITMILLMLAIVAAVIVFAYLRVAHTGK